MRTPAAALIFALACSAAAAQPSPSSSATAPHGATHVAIDYVYRSFHSNELHYALDWDGHGYRVAGGTRAIDSKWVDALYAALTDLTSSFPADLQCISHTDDYPAFKLAVQGAQPLEVASSSNCHAHVPWNVVASGARSAQFTGALDRAVRDLLVAIDPAHWTSGPDSPEATTSGPGEFVGIGIYADGGDHNTPTAEACARAFERDPRAANLFGQAIHIEQLGLGCDLGESADCSRATALARIALGGVEVRMPLACSLDGHADLAASADAISDLRGFLASKPVVGLLGLTSGAARVVRMQSDWQLMASDQPVLRYRQHSRQIVALSLDDKGPSGVAFWRAIGIDAAKLAKPQNGMIVTQGTVDFDGKLVP